MVIVSDIDAARATLQDLIERSEGIIAFTGAGISTECGLPDFRSKKFALPRIRPGGA